MIDPEAILDALAAGDTAEKAAMRFHMPADEIRKILKDEIERCLDGQHVREEWALADRRLATIERKFYQRALEEGDTASAMVFVKVNERRAILNGANMSSHHVLEVVRRSEPPKMDSTERIYQVIERFAKMRNLPPPNGAEQSESEAESN